MTLVTSAAVEETVPDVVRARELDLPQLRRPELLAQLLNQAHHSIAVGGTSGKSTVTGMIGWILHACHRQPTVMNGAVMKNFVTPSAPFASAVVGDPELFVSEVDESDGSIALYQPQIAVLTNISLDHKEMDELRGLFAGFLGAARKCVLNMDDPETRALAEALPEDKRIGYGLDAPGTALSARSIELQPAGSNFTIEHQGERHEVRLGVPGRHNIANAMAAIAAVAAIGVPVAEAAAALERFEGLRRRLETVGTRRRRDGDRRFRPQPRQDRRDAGDAARPPGAAADHVPAARLRADRQDGRGACAKLRRRHGGGRPAVPARPGLPGRDGRAEPRLGLAGRAIDAPPGGIAEHVPERSAIGERLVDEARDGDRIVIMGARDDSLSEFAAELVERIGSRN